MKKRILWLLVCMLLCTTMAACARREAPQLPTAEVQTQPETPEPTQETEPSQAPEAVSYTHLTLPTSDLV